MLEHQDNGRTGDDEEGLGGVRQARHEAREGAEEEGTALSLLQEDDKTSNGGGAIAEQVEQRRLTALFVTTLQSFCLLAQLQLRGWMMSHMSKNLPTQNSMPPAPELLW